MSVAEQLPHYQGLLASWYDTLCPPGGADVEFYREAVLAAPGKVLELGCGTGRLLVPYRQAGADIGGIDAAPDMLAICQRKLAALGLTARLLHQDMAALDTGERYALVLAAGGVFQVLAERQAALACLRAVHDHLAPQGRLVLDLTTPWDDIRAGRDGAWRQAHRAENERGERLVVHECSRHDLTEQIRSGSYRYEIYRGGRLTETMAADYRMRWYGRHEFVLLLEKAGFAEVRIEGGGPSRTLGEAVVYSAARR